VGRSAFLNLQGAVNLVYVYAVI